MDHETIVFNSVHRKFSLLIQSYHLLDTFREARAKKLINGVILTWKNHIDTENVIWKSKWK